jgi:hypothetical protein
VIVFQRFLVIASNYNVDRMHLWVGKDSPCGRPVEQRPGATPTLSACPGSAAGITAMPGARRCRQCRVRGSSGPRRRRHRQKGTVCPRSEGVVHSRVWRHDPGPDTVVQHAAQPGSHAVLLTDCMLATYRSDGDKPMTRRDGRKHGRPRSAPVARHKSIRTGTIDDFSRGLDPPRLDAPPPRSPPAGAPLGHAPSTPFGDREPGPPLPGSRSSFARPSPSSRRRAS